MAERKKLRKASESDEMEVAGELQARSRPPRRSPYSKLRHIGASPGLSLSNPLDSAPSSRPHRGPLAIHDPLAHPHPLIIGQVGSSALSKLPIAALSRRSSLPDGSFRASARGLDVRNPLPSDSPLESSFRALFELTSHLPTILSPHGHSQSEILTLVSQPSGVAPAVLRIHCLVAPHPCPSNCETQLERRASTSRHLRVWFLTFRTFPRVYDVLYDTLLQLRARAPPHR